VLFNQGDRGDLVYVVEQGEVEVYRTRADGGEEVLAVVGVGQYFGELGPMLNLPRSASARAQSPCRLTGYPVARFVADSPPRADNGMPRPLY
jgi:putative ABC transport system ATP-binding protein